MLGADANEAEKEFEINFLQKCIVEEFSLHESEGEIFKAIIDLLISAGIDLNHQDIDCCTALHLAVEFKQFDLAKLLIEKGAIPSNVDCEGKTAYGYLKEIDPDTLTELVNKHRENLLELLT